MYKLSADTFDAAHAIITQSGDTDIFPTPFEFDAIAHSWDEVRQYLTEQDLVEWLPQQPRTTLTPKSRFSYRVASQLDPLDTLIFTALVLKAGASIEAQRAPREFVHSYRFNADRKLPYLFDKESGWRSFLASSRENSDAADVSHVVITDIADFYNRIYNHPLENALKSAIPDGNLASVLFKFTKELGGEVSYGLPVGPEPSRLLAELVISDVDQHLMAESISFCRYVDDYRLFCSSEREAFQALSSLATALHENHGLTLQPQKTQIMTVEQFRATYLSTAVSEELSRLRAEFGTLNVGRYEVIDFDRLTPDLQDMVRAWNLQGMIEDELGQDAPDFGIVRFALDRLAQTRDPAAAEFVVDHVESLYLAFPGVIRYLAALPEFDGRDKLGGRIIQLMSDQSIVGHLPFHRYWLLQLFTSPDPWKLDNELYSLAADYPDSFTKREVTLALGRAGAAFWFKLHRKNVLNLDPWDRRAFLAAASCRNPDERKHWYQSIDRRLSPLERWVVHWARAQPF